MDENPDFSHYQQVQANACYLVFYIPDHTFYGQSNSDR